MRALLLIILISSCFYYLKAQNISSIYFDGLDKVDSSYVQRFIKTRPGNPVDHNQILRDEMVLQRLEVFSSVSHRLDSVGHDIALTFEFREVGTLLPIVAFGGIRENIWFRLGMSEINLNGKGMKMYGIYQFYDRSSFFAGIEIPYLHGSGFGISTNISKRSTLEPLYFPDGTSDYNFDNYAVQLRTRYELNFNNRFYLETTAFKEVYEKVIPMDGQFTPGPERVDLQKFQLAGEHQVNAIRHNYFYQEGVNNIFRLETVLTEGERETFFKFYEEFKYLKLLGRKGNFASRFSFGLSSNTESPFAPFVLDSYVNIRGSGNRIDRGTGALVLNLEYRHTVMELDKYAAQIVVFSDSGSWRNPGGEINDFIRPENFVTFAGGGARLIYKKIFNAILRLDYGVDIADTQRNGFVIGIGQYF
ncbi:MAG: hypothetical protein MI975_23930 [Cytophagales bacterium]|nr:hypothetical protein [Cytophagales bacterium]